jgi:hypothetical protein
MARTQQYDPVDSADHEQPPPAYEKPSDSDLSDDEDALDTLLSEEDPMAGHAGGKAHKKKQRRLRKTLRHKKRGSMSVRHRRFLIFGTLTMVILGIVAGAYAAMVHIKGGAVKEAVDGGASVEEVIGGMTEVPTLIGTLPIDQGNPVLNNEAAKVPPIGDDEKVTGTEANEPPALSDEAVEQAINTKGQLADKTAEAVDAFVDALEQASEDGLDALDRAGDTFMDRWNNLIAWFDAKWDDLVGNTPGTTDVY